MDVDPVALAQQPVQSAHGCRQAAPLIGGIEIAQRVAFHRQTEPAAVADLAEPPESLMILTIIMNDSSRSGSCH